VCVTLISLPTGPTSVGCKHKSCGKVSSGNEFDIYIRYREKINTFFYKIALLADFSWSKAEFPEVYRKLSPYINKRWCCQVKNVNRRHQKLQDEVWCRHILSEVTST
jgi:hypothetical protein